MYAKLTIAERLKDLRVERGLTLEQLAEQTGISRSALGQYEADDYKDISPFSIITLAKYYGVSTDYLMGMTETKNHPNTALDELHLSDKAIDFLKSDAVNTRLLCELMTHDDFWRLMADIEIYVDRIASQQITNINYAVDSVRAEMLERLEPEQRDRYLHTLEAAHVDEDAYFAHAVHDDIDGIMRDIKEAHRRDNTTADDNAMLAMFMSRLKEALGQPGHSKDKLAYVFFRMLDIPAEKMTPEEISVMAKALSLSPILKNGMSMRGKGKRRR